MLTGNTFMTNVLYGEAVKVSLYAIPESTSRNCMLAIKKSSKLIPLLKIAAIIFTFLSALLRRFPRGIPTKIAIIEK